MERIKTRFSNIKIQKPKFCLARKNQRSHNNICVNSESEQLRVVKGPFTGRKEAVGNSLIPNTKAPA